MALTLVASAAACGPNAPAPTGLSVSGVVVSVDGPNAAQVERFTLRSADGRQLTFVVGTLDVSEGGLPAPHLREHLLNGDPITVSYRVENGQNLALRYVDAS